MRAYSPIVRLGRVIARRQLTRGHGRQPVAVVEIGQPQKTRRPHEYGCPFRILGIGDETVQSVTSPRILDGSRLQETSLIV